MISFIIPTLNEEKGIEKTLKCLMEYSGEKEVIITDGNSADATLSLVRKYTDKIVVHTSPERQTIAQGRNEGAKRAQGDFFVFIDADVHIYDINSFFKKAFKIFEQDPKLVALTVSYKVIPEMATLADKIVFGISAYFFVLVNNILRVGGSGGEFQMIKAEAFKQINGFNPKLVVTEDNEIFQRLAKIGHTHCERGLAIYHSGRRAHKIGWPRLLYQWTVNYVYMIVLKRSAQDEWTPIR